MESLHAAATSGAALCDGAGAAAAAAAAGGERPQAPHQGSHDPAGAVSISVLVAGPGLHGPGRPAGMAWHGSPPYCGTLRVRSALLSSRDTAPSGPSSESPAAAAAAVLLLRRRWGRHGALEDEAAAPLVEAGGAGARGEGADLCDDEGPSRLISTATKDRAA
jgi:hypothetical protein